MKYKPKTKPFPHQAKATLRAVRARNYGIFFEPRLGKSKAALDYCGIMALKETDLRVLIIAPRIALEVWDGQIRKHYPHWYHAEDFEEEWEDSRDIDSGLFGPTWFFLAGREETFRRERVGGSYVRKKQRILEAWGPDVVILDESHEYKRAGGVAAQDAWRMIRRLRQRRYATAIDKARPKPWVLLLSGTPTPKGYADLFAPFRIMDEDILGTAKQDFEDRFVIRGTGRRKWTIIGYKNERKLERKVRENSIAVSADEASLANKQFFETLRVSLPAEVKQMYLQLAEEFIVEWEGGVIDAANAGVKRLRLLQLVGGFTTDGGQIHGAKVDALRAYLSLLLEQGESVVVYARFTPEVAAAFDTAERVGYRSFRVDGSVSRGDRSRAIATLAKRPTTPTAIVFQYQAGSRAIELVGAAETVYYSTPDGWIDYFQTLKRTQGPNQKRPVRYTHLVVPGTVDVGVIRGLKQKEDWHAQMMQNPRRYLLGL